MSFQMTSFENILNYFKLRNCGLNSKLCAKPYSRARKLCFSVISVLQQFCVVIWIKEEKHKFLTFTAI